MANDCAGRTIDSNAKGHSMAKPFTEWTVLPHGKPIKLDDNLFTVVGPLHMPIGDFPRRMTVVRLSDGRLVIYSAMALDEPAMAELEAWGTPTFLVVPSDIHRLDIRAWKARYPQLIVIAPEGSRAKIEAIVHVDQVEIDFGDPNLHFVTVPGTTGHEAALVLHTTRGSTLIVNDLIWNVADLPGFGGRLMHAIGGTGDTPRIPRFVAWKLIKDKPAMRAQLEAWSRLPQLNRIIVSHGEIITHEPEKLLHRLAESIAA
jgi:hypothetical protein